MKQESGMELSNPSKRIDAEDMQADIKGRLSANLECKHKTLGMTNYKQDLLLPFELL